MWDTDGWLVFRTELSKWIVIKKDKLSGTLISISGSLSGSIINY